MGERPDMPREEQTVAASPGAGARKRRLPPLVLAASTMLLGLLAVGALVDLATSSPKLCEACHEIRPRYESWERSPHATVACVSCHQPATRWYELPQRLVGRTRLLGHDLIAHVSGGYDDPVDRRVSGTTSIHDDNCLACHDPRRRATSGYRIRIDHARHAERNGSCMSCHVRVAHPLESRGNALSLMAQCFTCHGVEKTAKASGACSLCHPQGYPLVPASHEPGAWRQRHGDVASSDPALCTMCHARKYCDDCHGLPIPHPSGWERESGHAVAAEIDRAVCEPCHGSRSDMCTRCHHSTYTPAKGTWVDQHTEAAKERGTAYCLQCHTRASCAECHMRL